MPHEPRASARARRTALLRGGLPSPVVCPMPQRRSDTPSGPSQRQRRAGEGSRHARAPTLARGAIHDPLLTARAITRPEVRLTPDLRLATIYVMPLAGKDSQAVLAALERHRKFIRAEVAHAVNLKFAPEIRFRADETFAEAQRIDALLRSPKVARDLNKA